MNTYSSIILGTDISSFGSKGFHCVGVAIFSRNVQGSSLIEKKTFTRFVIFYETCEIIYT